MSYSSPLPKRATRKCPAAFKFTKALVQQPGKRSKRHMTSARQSRKRQLTHSVVLLDCLTLLVSNLLLSLGDSSNADEAEERVRAEIDVLLDSCNAREGTVIIVSGEVGLGLVPEYPLGRLYRDLLGWANQAVAARAHSTYLLVAGHAVELKQLAHSIDQAAAGIVAGEKS